MNDRSCRTRIVLACRIFDAVAQIEQFPRRLIQAQRKRVDRHVAPQQIVFDRRWSDHGQCRRIRVVLGTGSHEIDMKRLDSDASKILAVPKATWRVSTPPVRSTKRSATAIASP